jgi:hypothetical protein
LTHHADQFSLVTGLKYRLIEKKFCEDASYRPEIDRSRVYLGSEQDFRSSVGRRVRDHKMVISWVDPPVPKCHDKLGHPSNTNWITEPSC